MLHYFAIDANAVFQKLVAVLLQLDSWIDNHNLFSASYLTLF